MLTDPVTTIIPTLNDGSKLLRAIQSVAQQQNILPGPIIVVDNGSSDGSIAQVASLTSETVRLISCGTRGAAAARNAGLNLVTTPIVAFLDADDVWHPDHLASAADALRRRSKPALYAGSARGLDEQGNLLWVSQPDRIGSPWGAKVLGRNRIVTSAVVINGAPFCARFPALEQVEDLGLWLRLFREGFSLVAGSHPTVDYTVSPPRYLDSVRRRNEWMLYRELRTSHPVGFGQHVMMVFALSLNHLLSRIL